MPMYGYECDSCGHEEDVIKPMVECNSDETCPVCNAMMRRDYCGKNASHCRVNYDKPIHSDSLAISPSQRKEHEKLFPNIRLDGQCRPVFDNYNDHEDYLDKTGFVKLPGKRKKKVKNLGAKKKSTPSL